LFGRDCPQAREVEAGRRLPGLVVVVVVVVVTACSGAGGSGGRAVAGCRRVVPAGVGGATGARRPGGRGGPDAARCRGPRPTLSAGQRADVQTATVVLYLGEVGFQPDVERAAAGTAAKSARPSRSSGRWTKPTAAACPAARSPGSSPPTRPSATWPSGIA
jgi:hypothetical protein